jgi:hypothetical protein
VGTDRLVAALSLRAEGLPVEDDIGRVIVKVILYMVSSQGSIVKQNDSRNPAGPYDGLE